MTDQALGTAVLLPEDEASLSKQIISNYFTIDGPQAKRLNYGPERSILDESSGDEEVRESGETRHLSTPRRKWVLEEIFTWEVALSAFVVLLALAHCMWMWNLVTLSVLDLEFGD